MGGFADYPEKQARTNGTIGSYGYAIKCLAEGLMLAQSEGFVTKEEAKREFRLHVGTIQVEKQRKRQAAALREEADELEQFE
jgi:hypothetical protein